MKREPAYWLLMSGAALFVSFTASLSNSIDLMRSMQTVAWMGGMYGAAWVASLAVDWLPRRWLLYALWAALPGMAAFHIQMTAPGARLWSPTALGNVACIVLLTALPLRHWLTVAMAVAVILLTGSRGAWLNAGAGLLTLALANPQLVRPLLKAKWLGLLIAPVLVWQAARGFERVDIWWTALMLIRDAPLTGWGPGTFGLFHQYPDAHNIALNLLAENGWPGLMAGGVFAAALGARVRELMRAAGDPLYVGVAASLVGLLAAGIIGVPTYEIPVCLSLAVLVGMVL